MSTLKLLRGNLFKRTLNCRFLCTENPDDGAKPPANKDTPKINDEVEDVNDKKKRMSSLLMSLKKSTVEDSKYETEKIVIKPISVVAKKHGKEKKVVKDAVIEVARLLGGDAEKTKDELHTRFKMHSISKSNMKSLLDNMPINLESKQKEKEVNEEPSNYTSYRTDYLAQKRQPKMDENVLKNMKVAHGVEPEDITDLPEKKFKSEEHLRSNTMQHRDNINVADYKKLNRSLLDSMPVHVESDQKEEEITLHKSDFSNYRPELLTYPEKESRKFVPDDRTIESAAPLNIFKCLDEYNAENSESILCMWDKCTNRENTACSIQAPRNAFEEMIQWTDSGRMWTFPIDNEVGMEEEKQYTFADHIFLDRHLDPWCPKTGPVRHFMIMVCHGLSKNPYLTVNRKLAHIQWYQSYFMDITNRAALTDTGIPSDVMVDETAEKLSFVNIGDYACTPLEKKHDRLRNIPVNQTKKHNKSNYPTSNNKTEKRRRRKIWRY